MKWLFRVAVSAVGALVLIAGSAVATAIWLMFAGGSAEGRRLGFFDSVFVEVRQTADGATQLGTGVNDPVPLVLAVVVATVFALAVFAVHDSLLERRRHLLAQAE